MTDPQTSERLINQAADLIREQARNAKLEASNKALASKFTFACERIVELEHELNERKVEFDCKTALDAAIDDRCKSLERIHSHEEQELADKIAALESQLWRIGLDRKSETLALETARAEVERLKAVNAAFDATNAELVASIAEVRRELDAVADVAFERDQLRVALKEANGDIHTLRGELHAKDLQIARLESALKLAISERVDCQHRLNLSNHARMQQGSGLAIGDTAAAHEPRVFTGLTTQQARKHFEIGARIVNCNGHEFVRLEASDEWLAQYEPFTATYPATTPQSVADDDDDDSVAEQLASNLAVDDPEVSAHGAIAFRAGKS